MYNCCLDFQRQIIKKPGKKGYTSDVKGWAQEIPFYSPAAYEVTRRKLILPAASTLRRWAGVLNVDPGFTDFSFTALGELVKKTADRDVLTCLMIDGMSIKETDAYDKYADKVTGLGRKLLDTLSLYHFMS